MSSRERRLDRVFSELAVFGLDEISPAVFDELPNRRLARLILQQISLQSPM